MNDLQRNFGCKLSMGFFVLLLGFFLFSSTVSAQVGEVGGPIVDIELVPVCDDGTTAFQVLQYVVGVASPSVLGYVDAEGNSYTLTATPTAGACDAGGAAGPDYTVAVNALCDNGTAFYRVAIFTDNTATPSTTADFELDLTTSYTPSGTVYTGPCASIETATITRTVTSSTGSITAGSFSWEICNEGTTNGTVTVNGGSAATLIPGSCTSYQATYNPVTRKYRISPAVTYVATGTTFAVVVEN